MEGKIIVYCQVNNTYYVDKLTLIINTAISSTYNCVDIIFAYNSLMVVARECATVLIAHYANSQISPFLPRPFFRASSRARGMEAAEVLPYL